MFLKSVVVIAREIILVQGQYEQNLSQIHTLMMHPLAKKNPRAKSLAPLLESDFYFQVGGHTRLMVLNPQTICKPLNYRELDFYQNIQDQDIKMFVPKYKGKLSILRTIQCWV